MCLDNNWNNSKYYAPSLSRTMEEDEAARSRSLQEDPSFSERLGNESNSASVAGNEEDRNSEEVEEAAEVETATQELNRIFYFIFSGSGSISPTGALA